MGRMIFFPMVYLPSEQEFERLKSIQAEIAGWRSYLVLEWNQKNFNEAEKAMSRQRFHTGLRHHWRVIVGGKVAESLTIGEKSS
jgi:hypothetical protein